MDKLLLVDGSNLLFQMFFGMPARIFNRNGKAVHGTIGFVGGLLKIIDMTDSTHVAVLFDGEHENVRTAVNPEYKSNRTDYGSVPESENPFSQLNDVYAAIDCLGIKRAETADCEVDDWIAGYTFAYGKDFQIVISSSDSDYFQLLTDNVSVLRYRGKNSAFCSPEYVRTRFGISPLQYPDFKSLVGDPTDNIFGAEKIGPKTAARLLNEFGSLENLLINASQIDRLQIRNSILNNAERLRVNYELIKLNYRGQLPFRFDELHYVSSKVSVNAVLQKTSLLP